MGEVCVICAEALDATDAPLAGCAHRFHRDCIIEWFRTGQPTCPLCRTDGRSAVPATAFDRARALRAHARRSPARVPLPLLKLIARCDGWNRRLKVARGALQSLRRAHRAVFKRETSLIQSMRTAERRSEEAQLKLGRYAHPAIPVAMFRETPTIWTDLIAESALSDSSDDESTLT